MTASAQPLEGSIVRLEPLGPEHADELWAASRDAAAWRWLSVVQPQTREAWDGWIAQALAQRDAGLELPYATISVATGLPVGSSRFLSIRPEHRSIEIGWTWLSPAVWGTGANTEAKLLMLEHAFESLGCRRVEFKTDALNERSRAALAALPARFEGVHRNHMLVREGESRDSAWYSVIDDEWPAVRDALGARLLR